MKLALPNHAKISNFGGADFSENACKGNYSKLFPALTSFFQKNRIGMLPLDQDPTARDARIGDDPQNGGAIVAGNGGGRSRAHLGLLEVA